MSELTFTAGAAGGQGRVVIIPDEHILCDTPLLLRGPASVPLAQAQKWRDQCLAHIDDKLVPGWAAVLESFDAYQALLVTPATTGYPDFLLPGRISRHGHVSDLSIARHANRLTLAYEKVVAAIAFMVNGGREAFEQRIRGGLDIYREGEALPIAATGAYLTTILGAAVRQWFFLNGDGRFAFFTWPVDFTEGKVPADPPFMPAGPKWDLARQHNNLLIQGSCFFLEGLSVARVHERLDNFLFAALRPDYLSPPESFIRFLTVDGVANIRTLIAFNPVP